MTPADPDELARTSAIDFAHHLVHHWQEELGTELLGAYARIAHLANLVGRHGGLRSL
jgi:hypothetical protein